jgi:hypothetical protein
MEALQVERRNAILDEQHDFVISILSGQSPQVTGVHGRNALAIAETVIQKIEEQQTTMRKSSLVEVPQWDATKPQRRAG